MKNFSSKTVEILVYTHVGDDTIEACRGTEFEEFIGLQYNLWTCLFHLESVLSIIQN